MCSHILIHANSALAVFNRVTIDQEFCFNSNPLELLDGGMNERIRVQ